MTWTERVAANATTNYVTSTGADPEFFLVDNASGDMIPSYEVLPSKKRAMSSASGRTSFYTDGFQGEFRLNSVGSCHDGVTICIGDALANLHALATKHNARLSLRDVMPIPAASRIEYSKHLTLGCAPSLNAYGKPPLQVENPALLPIRFAGGHIHFGLHSKLLAKDYIPVIKALDAVSGVMGVLLGHTLSSPDRRQFYGVAGEYRLPSYGLEYRTLSPFWLCHPTVTYFTLDLARKVVNQMLLRGKPGFSWIGDEEAIQQCINSNNPATAREILESNKEELTYLIWLCYQAYIRESSIRPFVDALLDKGLALFCKDPEALALNWNLTPNLGYSYPQVRTFLIRKY